MGIQHSPVSAYVKEMQKWESRPVMVGDTMIMPIPIEQGGKMNHPYQEFPKMLYRASRADGGPQITDQLIVHTAQEEALKTGQGWSASQEGAIQAIHAEDQEFAVLAANRAYHDRRMSENARAEADAADAATMSHVPEVPRTPVKRGRQPKTVSAPSAGVSQS